MRLYPALVSTLGSLALVAFGSALVISLLLTNATGRTLLEEAFSDRRRTVLGLGFGVAAIAMSGSLYLSEIAHLVPCELCWFQRIAMYPMVPLLAIGWLRGDIEVWRYGLALSIPGAAIAAYHVTIQWMPTLEVGTCGIGAPCTARYVAVFGFVSIPTMAGSAFLLLTALFALLRHLKNVPNE